MLKNKNELEEYIMCFTGESINNRVIAFDLQNPKLFGLIPKQISSFIYIYTC